MVRVGLAAPHFDGTAVVDGHLVQLRWQQVHEDKTLVLLFDPIDGAAHSPEYLIAVSNAVARLSRPHANLAVVWRNDAHETLAWANRPPSKGGPGALAFPLIADPDGCIAALYDLLVAGSTPLWGQFLIDPAGIIRQLAVSGIPVCAGVDELLRIIEAVGGLTPSSPA
jgi:peroxiredoxin (alkyl hydroperoxide reductase subunit C)